MSVATHLGIRLDEYDARIRTFIPDYEEMLDVAAALVPPRTRALVDLGVGTGALAARCVAQARHARVVGIDADQEILAAAAERLGPRATLMAGTFQRTPLPRADAIVASFALHHVRTRRAKADLYRKIRRALVRGGVMITVDCHPSADARLAARQHRAWRAHLERAYSPRESAGYLRAWADEDVYVPLEAEVELMRRSGLRPDIVWRKNAFAVIVAR